MTPDHDIDRVLDRWLTEGPTQMPGRFLDETLDRIDRMPSGHLVGLRARLRPMHVDPRLAVAAAVIVAIAAAMSFMVLRGPAVGVNPIADANRRALGLRSLGHRVVRVGREMDVGRQSGLSERPRPGHRGGHQVRGHDPVDQWLQRLDGQRVVVRWAR